MWKLNDDVDADGVLKGLCAVLIAGLILMGQVIGCTRLDSEQATLVKLQAIRAGLVEGKIPDKPGVYWVKPESQKNLVEE